MIFTGNERGPKAKNLSKEDLFVGESELTRELNKSLHALSQPMTVLLCALEYANRTDSLPEIREMLGSSQEACERLRVITEAMRKAVLKAMKKGGEGRSAKARGETKRVGHSGHHGRPSMILENGVEQ